MIAAAKELGLEMCRIFSIILTNIIMDIAVLSIRKKYKDKLPIPDKILLYGDYYDNELTLSFGIRSYIP